MFPLFRTSLILLFIAVPMRFGAASSPLEQDPARTLPLRWRDAKITLSISKSFEASVQNIRPGTDVMSVVRRSSDTWSAATGLEFVIVWTDIENVSRSGPAGDGINLITAAPSDANSRVFANGSEDAPATTRLFYGRQGYISEADIVLNSTQQFSDDGTFGTFDLESIMTHEIGHLLGLEHSPISGTVMYPQHAKNGLFAEPTFWGRNLFASDLSAARTAYGSPDADVECCYRIEGNLPLIGTKRKAIVWAENAATGAVTASRTSEFGAPFVFDGLEAGHYRVFFRQLENAADLRGTVGSREVRLSTREPIGRVEFISPGERASLRLDQIGLNGQLSRTAATVEAGGRYTLYLAGIGLTAGKLRIASTSPFLTFEPGSIRSHDYGSQVSIISVDVAVDSEAPSGSYSIAVSDVRGARSVLPGSVVVLRR